VRELHHGLDQADDEEPTKVEEVKKLLQQSVASYFDRLQEEEREKQKQEHEQRERRKRLPILLMVRVVVEPPSLSPSSSSTQPLHDHINRSRSFLALHINRHTIESH
jgi:hypothetical protein